jgi:hypothetical protein
MGTGPGGGGLLERARSCRETLISKGEHGFSC